MKKYNVHYKVWHTYDIEVEASDEYEAQEKANDIWMDVENEDMEYGGEDIKVQEVITNGDTVNYVDIETEGKSDMTLLSLNKILKDNNISDDVTITICADDDMWQLSICCIFYNEIRKRICLCCSDSDENLSDFDEKFQARYGWKRIYRKDDWKELF